MEPAQPPAACDGDTEKAMQSAIQCSDPIVPLLVEQALQCVRVHKGDQHAPYSLTVHSCGHASAAAAEGPEAWHLDWAWHCQPAWGWCKCLWMQKVVTTSMLAAHRASSCCNNVCQSHQDAMKRVIDNSNFECHAVYVKCSVEVTLHETLLLLIKHALCLIWSAGLFREVALLKSVAPSWSYCTCNPR